MKKRILPILMAAFSSLVLTSCSPFKEISREEFVNQIEKNAKKELPNYTSGTSIVEFRDFKLNFNNPDFEATFKPIIYKTVRSLIEGYLDKEKVSDEEIEKGFKKEKELTSEDISLIKKSRVTNPDIISNDENAKYYLSGDKLKYELVTTLEDMKTTTYTIFNEYNIQTDSNISIKTSSSEYNFSFNLTMSISIK